MKKLILTAAFAVSISSITIAQTETIEKNANEVEMEVTFLKSDVETLSQSVSISEETNAVERIKKGTNMLLPSICEIRNATNDAEILKAVNELLELVNSIDNDSEALLSGFDKVSIKNGMVEKTLIAHESINIIQQKIGVDITGDRPVSNEY